MYEDIYSDLDNFNVGKSIDELEDQNNSLTSQIEELQKKLNTVTKEVSEVKRLNHILQTNISSLFKTARSELERKDKLVASLRKQVDDFMLKRNQGGQNFRIPLKRFLDVSEPEIAEPSCSKKPKYDNDPKVIISQNELTRTESPYQSNDNRDRCYQKGNEHNQENNRQKRLYISTDRYRKDNRYSQQSRMSPDYCSQRRDNFRRRDSLPNRYRRSRSRERKRPRSPKTDRRTTSRESNDKNSMCQKRRSSQESDGHHSELRCLENERKSILDSLKDDHTIRSSSVDSVISIKSGSSTEEIKMCTNPDDMKITSTKTYDDRTMLNTNSNILNDTKKVGDIQGTDFKKDDDGYKKNMKDSSLEKKTDRKHEEKKNTSSTKYEESIKDTMMVEEELEEMNAVTKPDKPKTVTKKEDNKKTKDGEIAQDKEKKDTIQTREQKNENNAKDYVNEKNNLKKDNDFVIHDTQDKEQHTEIHASKNVENHFEKQAEENKGQRNEKQKSDNKETSLNIVENQSVESQVTEMLAKQDIEDGEIEDGEICEEKEELKVNVLKRRQSPRIKSYQDKFNEAKIDSEILVSVQKNLQQRKCNDVISSENTINKDTEKQSVFDGCTKQNSILNSDEITVTVIDEHKKDVNTEVKQDNKKSRNVKDKSKPKPVQKNLQQRRCNDVISSENTINKDTEKQSVFDGCTKQNSILNSDEITVTVIDEHKKDVNTKVKQDNKKSRNVKDKSKPGPKPKKNEKSIKEKKVDTNSDGNENTITTVQEKLSMPINIVRAVTTVTEQKNESIGGKNLNRYNSKKKNISTIISTLVENQREKIQQDLEPLNLSVRQTIKADDPEVECEILADIQKFLKSDEVIENQYTIVEKNETNSVQDIVEILNGVESPVQEKKSLSNAENSTTQSADMQIEHSITQSAEIRLVEVDTELNLSQEISSSSQESLKNASALSVTTKENISTSSLSSTSSQSSERKPAPPRRRRRCILTIK